MFAVQLSLEKFGQFRHDDWNLVFPREGVASDALDRRGLSFARASRLRTQLANFIVSHVPGQPCSLEGVLASVRHNAKKSGKSERKRNIEKIQKAAKNAKISGAGGQCKKFHLRVENSKAPLRSRDPKVVGSRASRGRPGGRPRPQPHPEALQHRCMAHC